LGDLIIRNRAKTISLPNFGTLSDSGSIDVSVSGVTFDVGISLGKSTNVNITKVQNFDVIEEIWQLIMKSE
jgi:hypothetical protein